MKTTRHLASIAFAAHAMFIQSANAAPGDLDLTFGGTGKVTTAIGSGGDFGLGMALQSDGKIVVVGFSNTAINNSDFAVVRYNADGALDTTFNGTGKAITDFGKPHDIARCVALQNDGKIVVAGESYVSGNQSWVLALARYNPNGTLDTTFNATGMVTTNFGGNPYAFSVIMQSDGKIVIAGTGGSHFALYRYNADGSLDTTFNGTGKVGTDFGGNADAANSIALQNDGKLVVAGYSGTSPNSDFALARYNSNGSLDTSFNTTGKVTTAVGNFDDRGQGVTIQGDGKIIVAGFSSNGSGGGSTEDFAIVRYNANGNLDTDFGSGGKVITSIGSGSDIGYSVAVQGDGKITVAGGSYNGSDYDFALVHYNTNGSLDTSFNGTGKLSTAVGNSDDTANSIALQKDGKLVVAGYSISEGKYTFAVVRYEGDYPDLDGDGIPDRFETGTGIYVSPQDTGTSPTNADTDGDELTDGAEVNTYHTNPNLADTDGDGFNDGFEVATGFSPTSAASTPDTLSSIRTAAEYRFNAANGGNYRIEASTDLINWSTIETNISGNGGVITRFYSIEGQSRRYFRSRRN